MARNGFKAMDCDMHVFEPADMWQRYIDPKFADRAPVGTGETAVTLEGKDLMGVPLIDTPGADEQRLRQLREREAVYKDHLERSWDSKSQLLAMAREGLPMAFLTDALALRDRRAAHALTEHGLAVARGRLLARLGRRVRFVEKGRLLHGGQQQ